MPAHLVLGPIAEGRLKALKLAEFSSFQFLAHVVHVRGHEIGRAGRWLIEDLRSADGRALTAYPRKNEFEYIRGD